jgi:hypothetical protein
MTQFKGLVTFLSLFFVLSASRAVEPEVQREIAEGDRQLALGEIYLANVSYIAAKGTAADLKDWDGFLILVDRFFKAKSEWHAKDCYLLALQNADFFAKYSSLYPNPAESCQKGINALISVGNAWTDIQMNTMLPENRTQMEAMARQCLDNAELYRKNGCT